jgi:hypothetical protein
MSGVCGTKLTVVSIFCVQVWMLVQRKWMYLESIFSR